VFRRFPTTTVIIRFLITRFIFQYYICRSLNIIYYVKHAV
jgi:hypothetical protein